MTNEALTRAQEVQSELTDLKIALSHLNKAQIFPCDEGSVCYGRKGSSFLSQTNIMIKGVGVKLITKRIKELENEFKKL